MGAARFKVTATDSQDIILPLPQLAGGQVPISYFIVVRPAEAASEIRLWYRDHDNVVLFVRLAGKKQDVQISWSSVVLLTAWDTTPNGSRIDPYRAETACVQAKSDAIAKLAAETWPKSGKPEEFAGNIQRRIRDMKRIEQPRTLDALGILKSGENSICTANANLASAVMRSKGIACRSMAVIPATSQKLEMHRIVEYAEKEKWIIFDPSSLQADIPAKPWQNIIMAKSTIDDEKHAMKPRMGVALGCPYGQEMELLTPGVTLSGQDFFWTVAKPLVEFEADEEATHLAAEAWSRYRLSGTLEPPQLSAASAKSAAEFAKKIKSKQIPTVTGNELRSLMEKSLSKHALPAIATGIVCGGEKPVVAVVGVRKRGEEAMASEDDLWHLGSNTKPITALLIAILIDLGLLDWDTPLGDIFPDQAEKWSDDMKKITPSHLLTHTSGLPAIGPIHAFLIAPGKGPPVQDRGFR